MSLRNVRRDWRFVTGLMSAVNFLELIGYYHMARFAPLFLRDDLHIAEADIPRLAGLVAASAMLTGVPTSPFWGALADRYGRKWLILRAEVVQLIYYAMVVAAGDVWMLFAARLVFGIAFGNAAMMMAVQSLVTPPAKVGLAIAIFQAQYPLAMSLAPILGTLLIKLVGLRGLFAFDLLVQVVTTLLIVFFLAEPPGRDTSTSFGKRFRELIVLAVRVPAIRWSFVLHFFLSGAFWGLDPFVPIAIQRANATSGWGWDEPTALGITLGVIGLVSALATPLLGRLTDRFGAVRVIVFSSLTAMVCVLGLTAVQSLPAVWGLLLLAAIPQVVSSAAFYAYLGTLVSPTHRSGVLGLTALPRNVANLVAPSLAAVATGLGFSAVFVVIGGFWLLAACSALHLQRLPPSSDLMAAATTGDGNAQRRRER